MKLNRRTVIGGVGAAALGAATAARSETTMSELPFAASAPTHIGRIGLVARDANALSAYYRDVVGLTELAKSGGHITLGVGDRPLMEIEESTAVRPDDPRSAGLYHTAFLLPSRADLGRWIKHAIENRIRLDGASDHLVSEALYLTDPEGNGVEIYADRAREGWAWDGDKVHMGLGVAGVKVGDKIAVCGLGLGEVVYVLEGATCMKWEPKFGQAWQSEPAECKLEGDKLTVKTKFMDQVEDKVVMIEGATLWDDQMKSDNLAEKVADLTAGKAKLQ